MIETFCLRLAGGLALALLVLPARAVSPRFFRTHLLIALCLLITGAVFAWDSAKEDTPLWAAVGLSAGVAVVAFWLWSAEGVGAGRAAVAFLAVLLLAALCFLPGKLASTGRWIMPVLQETSSAAFLGLALTAMLLGHWYLIAPTMSLAPLLRIIAGLAGANLARLLVAGFGLGALLLEGRELDRLAWLWLAVRWFAGLMAPLGLIWMAWQAARLRATQSATGILYVVVIFVFFGELTDQLFQEHAATLPGGVP